MDKTVGQVEQENVQGVIPISKAQELMERVANGVAHKIMAAFGVEDKPEEEKAPEVPALDDGAIVDLVGQQMTGLIPAGPSEMVKESERTANSRSYELKDGRTVIIKVLPSSKTAVALTTVSSETPQPAKVEEEHKEEVMASEVKVTADAKQNSKAGEVSGFQSGESASSGPKGNVPVVPGKVLTEGPALDTLPKAQKTGFELKTDHEAMAAQADKEIEALKRGKGMLSEKSKLASTMLEVRKIAANDEGLRLVESFIAYAKKKAKNQK